MPYARRTVKQAITTHSNHAESQKRKPVSVDSAPVKKRKAKASPSNSPVFSSSSVMPAPPAASSQLRLAPFLASLLPQRYPNLAPALVAGGLADDRDALLELSNEELNDFLDKLPTLNPLQRVLVRRRVAEFKSGGTLAV